MHCFVITGPSGSGKTSLIKALVAADQNLRFSVSCTTRPKREGEVQGRDYYFIDRKKFEDLVAKNQMLEWAEVHGNLYGTPRAELAKAEALFKQLVLDIDCAGAAQVREQDIDAHFIFVLVPSKEILERRLRNRKGDSDEEVERRLAAADEEMRQAELFGAWIENDKLEKAAHDLAGLIALLRMKVRPDERRFRNRDLLNRVSSTFFTQPA
ncbi:guanylate kinase [Candidatus Parcubacteria bacterium]|nr:guanylate kinase [Candidatus Parcubacteria bacterium]